MEKAELELQLKVWKDLAVAKQVLMTTATKALGLKAECSNEELENALKNNTKRIKELETELSEAQSKAKAEIDSLNKQLLISKRQTSEALAGKEEAKAANEASLNRIEVAKAANLEEVKKLKQQITEKQKEIKQITKVLADTPENVVKKLKALKKEKLDEANDRKRAEETSRRLRKERQTAEQKLEDSKNALENAAKLIESYRELNKFANEQYDKLAETAKEKKSLEKVPFMDEELLDAIEAATKVDDKTKKENKKQATKEKKETAKA